MENGERSPISIFHFPISAHFGARLGLVGGFLLFIAAVPLVQVVSEVRHHRPIQALDVFKQVPTLENLQAYERALERGSVAARAIRPYTQWLWTRFTRRGNEKVVVGLDGWLFYRPSVDHLVGPGFLPSPSEGNPHLPEGDALTAILLFRDSLRAHGVDLLLLPVPGKETLYPEHLSPGYPAAAGPPANPDTARFLAALRRSGVAVFDPTGLLWQAKGQSTEPLYLPLDTHWSPRGLALVARRLADRIRQGGYLNGIRPVRYRVERVAVENRGDLYDMLDLPPRANSFRSTRVVIEQVIRQDSGELCRPDPSSPVLLLGDSFTNVFSDPSLGWGEAAGLAEHLALELGIGLDVIALNDGGVNGSRERLARRPAALVGKRLVLWQFAARDLTAKAGEWKRIPLPPPVAAGRQTPRLSME